MYMNITSKIKVPGDTPLDVYDLAVNHIVVGVR
jgi:hypothetical protein